MSNEYLNIVWATRLDAPSEKLVLVRLADRADASGVCWPSVDSLARDCGLSARSVQRAIGSLERRGLLICERRIGHKTRFHIAIKADATRPSLVTTSGTPSPPANPHMRHTAAPDTVSPTPDTVSPTRDIVSPITIINKPNEPTSHSADARAPTASAVASRSDRGIRLPVGWEPDAAGRQIARDLNLDPDQVLEQFRDYWMAVPSLKGRKTDWSATWRNWCRRELQHQSGGMGANSHACGRLNDRPRGRRAWLADPPSDCITIDAEIPR